MLGEFLREAAILILVFGFLDQLLAGRDITTVYGVAVAALSGFFFMRGVVLELSRGR